MKRFKMGALLLASMLLMTSAMMAQTKVELSPKTALWKLRPLLLVTVDPGAQTTKAQADKWSSAKVSEEMKARDIVLITLVTSVEDPTKVERAFTAEGPLDQADGQAWLDKLDSDSLPRTDENPGVYLLGKDGGVKLARTKSPASPQEIFDLVDTMPMRREEMAR